MIQLLQPSRKFLTYLAVPDYPKYVTEKEVTWGESQNYESARTAQCGFFSCVCLRLPSMVGGGRGVVRLTGVLSCLSLKLYRSLTPSFESEVVWFKSNEGGFKMPSTNTSKSKDQSSTSSYQFLPGVQVSIQNNQLLPHAHMRAAQLSALLEFEELAANSEHSTVSEKTQSNFRWLAATLANEITALLDLANNAGVSHV